MGFRARRSSTGKAGYQIEPIAGQWQFLIGRVASSITANLAATPQEASRTRILAVRSLSPFAHQSRPAGRWRAPRAHSKRIQSSVPHRKSRGVRGAAHTQFRTVSLRSCSNPDPPWPSLWQSRPRLCPPRNLPHRQGSSDPNTTRPTDPSSSVAQTLWPAHRRRLGSLIPGRRSHSWPRRLTTLKPRSRFPAL